MVPRESNDTKHTKIQLYNIQPKTKKKIDNLNLVIKNEEIKPLQNIKYLGINIDESLSWTKQVENICKKLSQLCYIIGQLRKSMEEKSLLTYYYAYGESAIRYGITLWAKSTEHQRILILQKRIVRKIYRKSYRSSVRQTFKEKGILTLYAIYYLESLLIIYKRKDLIKNQDNHQYNTRHAKNIIIPSHNTTFYEKTAKYNGIKYFNNLTEQTKNLKEQAFKDKVREEMLKLAPYSFKEIDFVKF